MKGLQLVEERNIVIIIRKFTAISIFLNQRSATYVGYRKQHRNFVVNKITLRNVGVEEMVLLNFEWRPKNRVRNGR